MQWCKAARVVAAQRSRPQAAAMGGSRLLLLRGAGWQPAYACNHDIGARQAAGRPWRLGARGIPVCRRRRRGPANKAVAPSLHSAAAGKLRQLASERLQPAVGVQQLLLLLPRDGHELARQAGEAQLLAVGLLLLLGRVVVVLLLEQASLESRLRMPGPAQQHRVYYSRLLLLLLLLLLLRIRLKAVGRWRRAPPVALRRRLRAARRRLLLLLDLRHRRQQRLALPGAGQVLPGREVCLQGSSSGAAQVQHSADGRAARRQTFFVDARNWRQGHASSGHASSGHGGWPRCAAPAPSRPPAALSSGRTRAPPLPPSQRALARKASHLQAGRQAGRQAGERAGRQAGVSARTAAERRQGWLSAGTADEAAGCGPWLGAHPNPAEPARRRFG